MANSDQWCRSADFSLSETWTSLFEVLEAELSHKMRRQGELPLQTTSQLLLIPWKEIKKYKYNGKTQKKR